MNKHCENCGKTHHGEYGSGRFCSIKCARSFSTKNKRKQINEKVSKTLKGSGNGKVMLTCQNCVVEFEVNWNKRNQKTCSLSCSSKLRWKNKTYKKKMSKQSSVLAIKRHKNNDDSFGWSTRKKLQPSYPEKIAIKLLNELQIDYEREMPIGKYFVDFAIHSEKIAIEIDGQQHNKIERKRTDRKKDKLLSENGWSVFRIKWPEDNIRNSIKNILNR
jgi:very-short-patch-repair endonuclease